MPKQVFELSDLDTDEVSIVDSPAIRRKFLVVKAEDTELTGDEQTAVNDVLAENGIEGGESTEEDGETIKGLWEQFRGKLAGAMRKNQPDAGDVHVNKPAKVKLDEEEERKQKNKEKKAMAEGSENGDGEQISKSDHDAAILKAVEDAKAEVTKTLTDAHSAEKSEIMSRLDVVEKKAELGEHREYVTEKKWPGDVEKNAALRQLMKSTLSDDDFKEWNEREDANAAQISKSALFTEVGVAGRSANGGSAQAATELAVKEYVAKAVEGGKDKYEAMQEYYETHPQDYAAAQAEHATTAKNSPGR